MPWRVVLDTLLQWAMIGLAWWIASQATSTPLQIACAVFVGTRYYALFIIGHDGLHRRLFPSRRWNDAWTDIFVLAPIGAITRINRRNHLHHHQTCGTEADPDYYKYMRQAKTPGALLISLTGVTMAARAVRNVFGRSESNLGRGVLSDSRRDNQIVRERYVARDFVILAAVNLFLVGIMTHLFGWGGYLFYWLIPIYVFTFAADLTRVYLEHCLFPGEQSPQRLVTIDCNWVERQFFAPMNMNRHVVHHLYPSIPYYNLEQADRLIREREARVPDILRRRSYVSVLMAQLNAVRVERRAGERAASRA